MAFTKISKNPFAYSKLPPGDYVRILKLLRPKRGSDTPRTLLAAFPLSEAENNYTAVSYAWGEPGQTKSILINDLECQVGENIFRFLSQARHYVKTYIGTALWIDAICINQGDTEEKNEQVQLMGKIYEQASRVTIWLGCEDKGTEMLFRCLQHVAKHQRKGNYTQPYDLSKVLAITTRVLQKDRLPSLIKILKIELARTLVWLFENDYWKRTWIVQECLLARENRLLVCCGKHCMSLDALMDFRRLGLEDDIFRQSAVQEWTRFSALFSHGEARSYNPGKIVIGYNDWYDELFALLQHIQIAKCSILHDKIFGILSLVQHSPKHEKIYVDYKMSLEELFFRSLACWTTGRLTVKLADQLILNLNLDLKNLRAEVMKNDSLVGSIRIAAHTRVPPIDFLMIRLGTVLEIETGPASPGTSRMPPTILLRFHGPYSPRLDLLGPDWHSTGSSIRSDSAMGFSSYPLEVGDVIFAFFDSMACLVFRKSDTKLVKVGCAILTGRTNTDEPNEASEIMNGSLSMLADLSQPEAFGHVEIDDSVEENELELNALAAMGVLDCHSVMYDWPPRGCVESQRHLRTQY